VVIRRRRVTKSLKRAQIAGVGNAKEKKKKKTQRKKKNAERKSVLNWNKPTVNRTSQEIERGGGEPPKDKGEIPTPNSGRENEKKKSEKGHEGGEP